MTNSKYSTYVANDLRADVIYSKGTWGCVYYKNNERVKKELYTGHSEAYAESAAENYVLGVKKLWTIYLKH